MPYNYLRIQRPTTGTTVIIMTPFEVPEIASEQVSYQLNSYVDYKYPGFEIVDLLTADQKKMLQIPVY
jgi:hypothetical protein